MDERDQQETLLRVRSWYEEQRDNSEQEELLNELKALDLALPRKKRWMRRADAVCLAVVGFVACYVAIWQPPVRQESPFWVQRQPSLSSVSVQPTADASLISRDNSTAKYMTYADIDAHKREHGYAVTYTERGFEIDGRKTLLIGGSIHYSRSTPGMWRDLLLKAKHDGLNHVQMYVFWNFHEQERGVFDFSGRRNLTQFYELAAELDMFLHVRFGPYVCAEWDNGGLPVWLNWMPGMQVRSSNALWEQEMERFMRYMVELARPFMASSGGPIVLAQIENEFSAEDPAYINWCGALVEKLNTSIPWVMCNGKSANNTILACNGDDCMEFAQNQMRDRPQQPLVWTENEGWYEKWAEKPEANGASGTQAGLRLHDNDQRSAVELAFVVARWFAVGGAAQNYYMYHGGNNYGRGAAAGVATKYADGVNLHADGLSNEPKRSHLRKLHSALISVNDILMTHPRQLPNPQPIGNSASRLSEAADLAQRAFVYGDDGQPQVAFLENRADTGAQVHFHGAGYYLTGQSVVILSSNKSTEAANVLFNTSDVNGSFPHQHRRVYTPLVAETQLKWQTWSELLDARGVPRKQMSSATPLEQLRVTLDKTDYLTYETSFRLSSADQKATLHLTSCEANSFLVFLNHRFVAEQHLAYPGDNCSMEFVFQLPVKVEEDDDSFARKHYHLTLVSVSLGIFSLGQDHRKGLTGSVRIDDLDLASHGNWKMLPGLVGEQLELFDPRWTNSVEWKPFGNQAVDADNRPKFPLMAWLKTSFQLPESAKPKPDTEQIEDVSSILLDCIGLTRGRAFINGNDLGRYWLISEAEDSDVYVQRYYHVPTDWLHFENATENLLVVFDELGGSVASVRLVVSTMVEMPANVTSSSQWTTTLRSFDSSGLETTKKRMTADPLAEGGLDQATAGDVLSIE